MPSPHHPSVFEGFRSLSPQNERLWEDSEVDYIHNPWMTGIIFRFFLLSCQIVI